MSGTGTVFGFFFGNKLLLGVSAEEPKAATGRSLFYSVRRYTGIVPWLQYSHCEVFVDQKTRACLCMHSMVRQL